MKTNILLLLIFLFCNVSTYSQISDTTEIMYRSENLKGTFNPNYSTSPKLKMGLKWFVISDRENNVTYKNPTEKIQLKVIDYLDWFWVVDENDTWLHIVKDLNPNGTKLSRNAEDYGWIEKKNMLIWNEGIKRDTKNLYYKAKINVPTAENVADKAKSVLKKSPLENSNSLSKSADTTFTIFKEDNDYLFIMNTEKITAPSYVKKFYGGWIHKKDVVWRKNNVFVEPNLNLIGKKKKDCYIFKNLEAAISYQKLGNVVDRQHLMAILDTRKQLAGDVLRLAILNNSNAPDGILTVGCPAKLKNIKDTAEVIINTTVIEKENIVESEIKMDNVAEIKEQKNVNVVIVIDANEGMKNMIPNIAKTLESSIELFYEMYRNDSSDYKIYKSRKDNKSKEIVQKLADKIKYHNVYQFGIVAYRDLNYGDSCLTEILPFTRNFKEAVNFINQTVKKCGKLQNFDGSNINYGLKTALTNLNWSEKSKLQTNVLFLFGANGQHQQSNELQISKEEIVKLATEKKCDLYFFQGNRKTGSKYDSFYDDNCSILLQTANNFAPKTLSDTVPKMFETLPNRFELINSKTISGFIIRPPADNEISVNIAEEVKQVLFYKYFQISENLQSIVNVIDNTTNTDISRTNKTNQQKTTNVKKKVKTNEPYIDKTLLEDALLENVGYIVLAPKNARDSLWSYTLLLSHNELKVLELKLDSLANLSASENEQRQQLKNVWKVVSELHTSERITKDLTDAEINQKLSGLPVKSYLLSTLKLNAITSPEKFPANQLKKYISRIQRNEKLINRIYGSHTYEYQFSSNESIYYWIPAVFMP